jgi:hypothetical protein
MGCRVRCESPGREEARAVRQMIVFLGLIFINVLFGFAIEKERSVPAGDKLRSLSIDGYFDPERNFLNATAKLSFAMAASERRLWLAEELNLKSVRSGMQPVLNFKRDCGQFQVLSPGEQDLELSYSGQLARIQNPFDPAGAPGNCAAKVLIDDYRFLSYINDFYPNPQIDFTPLNMKFSVPKGWNCLGSGRLCSMQSEQALNTFEFDNSEAKGMAVVCGRFSQVGLIDGVIPLKLYGGPGFQAKRYFSTEDMARVISFYRERFGPLQVPELNVLFRRGRSFGGVSYCGLIVLNLDESWTSLTAKARSQQRSESPLSMIDAELDLLAHEMAHQWWGGLLSWKAPEDNWITEGMATYSSLLFLRSLKGENAYRKTLTHLRRWVRKYGSKGACADGFRLRLRSRDLRVYQTLVYVKPALMLAELADIIGEGELCLRLQGILKARRCCNVDSEEFLRLLSAGDEDLRAGLTVWIQGRGLPKGL